MTSASRIYLVTTEGTNFFFSAFDYSTSSPSIITPVFYNSFGSGGTPLYASSSVINSGNDAVYIAGSK